MNQTEKNILLDKAEDFFRNSLAVKHLINLNKLTSLSEFDVNPFLIKYLARFLSGNDDAISIAKALVYPRILGTSINTSFGQNIQKFCSEVLGVTGTIVSGTDIEFMDQVDGRKKYCQIKAGPNTINKDDIETILHHFKDIKFLARQNNRPLQVDDLVVGVLYGSPEKLNAFYKKISEEYPIYVGEDFWYRFTGDKEFYKDLSERFGKVALEIDAREALDKVISELSKNIQQELLKN